MLEKKSELSYFVPPTTQVSHEPGISSTFETVSDDDVDHKRRTPPSPISKKPSIEKSPEALRQSVTEEKPSSVRQPSTDKLENVHQPSTEGKPEAARQSSTESKSIAVRESSTEKNLQGVHQPSTEQKPEAVRQPSTEEKLEVVRAPSPEFTDATDRVQEVRRSAGCVVTDVFSARSKQ